uniref:Deoxyribonuclease II n=1 Tax=Trichuris muris TaxID=70415 RepID=A0A5S6QTP5_TRIMR
MELRFITLLLLVAAEHARGDPQCKTANDSKDWALYYKKRSSDDAHVFYADTTSADWEKDTVDLDSELSEMFNNLTDTHLIAYSDFPPHARAAIGCASKARGVFAFNDKEGWLISHTVDQWPNIYAYKPPNEKDKKAAVILCVSIKDDAFEHWGEVMDYQDPLIYASKGDSLDNYPALKNLINAPTTKTSPYVKTGEIQSSNSPTLTVRIFSKLPQGRIDIYSNLIALSLKKNLIVWSKPDANNRLLNSTCSSTYKVENVNQAKPIKLGTESISRKDDSSTWAISKAPKLFCMGNADRTEADKSVGAGVLCFENENVHTIFKKIANSAGRQSC